MTDFAGKTVASTTYGQGDSWLEIVFTDGTAVIINGTGWEADGVSVESTTPGATQKQEDEWKAREAARPKTPLEKMLIEMYTKAEIARLNNTTLLMGSLEGFPLPTIKTTD